MTYDEAHEFLVSQGHEPGVYCPLKFDMMFEAAQNRLHRTRLETDHSLIDSTLVAVQGANSKQGFTQAKKVLKSIEHNLTAGTGAAVPAENDIREQRKLLHRGRRTN